MRVVPATKWMASLPSADSTSVLPHQPSPTMPALITCNSRNFSARDFTSGSYFGDAICGQGRYLGQVSTASAMHVSIQNTQYSTPPITQIHFLVTL